MSLTALLWALAFVILLLAAFRAPAWGAALYMLTFFALPQYWWWGKAGPLATPRWNLMGGVVFLLSVVLTYRPHPMAQPLGRLRAMRWMLMLIALNYVLVSLVLAENLDMSSVVMFIQVKLIVLVFLLDVSIQDEINWKRIVLVMFLGILFLAFEVNFRGAGKSVAGRLEGVGVPGGNTSNHLGNLLITFMPMLGAGLFSQDRKVKLVALVTSPLALNTLLKCNSRGSYLGLIAAGSVMLLLSRGRERKLLFGGALLGCLGVLVLARDGRIFERFTSTFVGEEQRDTSAQSRIAFWKAALVCLSEHPAGVGGDCYKNILSRQYLVGVTDRARAIHNGFLNEAVQWGVHSLLLRLGVFYLAFRCARSGQAIYRRQQNFQDALMGLALVGGLVAFSVGGFFGDYWDSEWGLQLVALCMGYYRIAVLREREQQSMEYAPAPFNPGPWGGMPNPMVATPQWTRMGPVMPG